jgi:hypothetical protein
MPICHDSPEAIDMPEFKSSSEMEAGCSAVAELVVGIHLYRNKK